MQSSYRCTLLSALVLVRRRTYNASNSIFLPSVSEKPPKPKPPPIDVSAILVYLLFPAPDGDLARFC